MTRGKPPSRPAGRHRQDGPARRAVGAVLRFAARRPGVVVVTIAMAGCAGAVSWNALHQANRHPAPLFGPRLAAQPVEPPRRPEAILAAPLPVPRPDLALAASAPPALPPLEAPALRPPAADPIGALIRAGDASGRPAEPQKVTSAQRALSKLGYGPLRADGVMGATTRQAVERFERDRNLPVTGTLGSRTARQLAAASGDPLD